MARWIREFVSETEAGPPRTVRGWRRGGGVEQLDGRLALVTGAGSGIGLATAVALADHGARVLLVDRDEAALARAAESIRGSRSLRCDVSDADAMQRLADEVLASEGVPDVVINNAGIAIAGPFLKTGIAEWRRIVDINLLGVVHGCRLFGQAMVERGRGGQIVNTASAAAFLPSKGLPAYSATKAAVLMLSECLRAELAPSGIGVTAVCPGFIATNITRAAQYVGRAEADQDRLREQVTRMYERRNFTAEQVAAEIVEAIGADLPVAVVTPEAKLMRRCRASRPGSPGGWRGSRRCPLSLEPRGRLRCETPGRTPPTVSERHTMLLKHRPPSIQSQSTTLRGGLEHLDQNWVAVLRWLNDNKVDYVIVGQVARGIRGDRDARGPVAIVPAPYGRNYERLCNALVAEHAGLRAEVGPRGLAPSSASIRSS